MRILFVGLNDWIIRNLIKSNFSQAATKLGFELHGLIYEQSYPVFKDIVKKELNMETTSMRTLQWDAYESEVKNALKFVEKGTHLKRVRTGNKTIKIFRIGKNPSSLLHRLKINLKYIGGKFLVNADKEDELYNTFQEVLIKSAYVQNTCLPFLNDLKPDLIISCSPETPYDFPWIAAADALNIKTSIWIRSWDNLTTKMAFLPEVDAAFLWSKIMTEEFRQYYPNYKTKIYEVGSLQFDGHGGKRDIIPYEQFCATVGLDPTRPFITYTTGGPHICKDEHLLIKKVTDRINSLDIENKPQILIRVHPYVWNTDYDAEYDYGNAIAWPPNHRAKDLRGGLTTGLLDDYQVMVSTFYYQSLNINIASTVTLDSCIFNKPVINIAFDPYKIHYLEISNRKYYQFDHYIPLIKLKGVRVVYNLDELEKEFLRYWKNPQADSEGRRRILEEVCGKVDGMAGERLAEGIKSLLSN